MAEIIHLTSEELARLTVCENAIRDGMESVEAAMSALKETRDNRLYRQEYKTFEAYCRNRWNMGANYAHKMISALEVKDVVPVKNERQARELSTLDAEERVEVWDRAAEDAGGEDKITAKVLSEAVKKFKRDRDPESVGPTTEGFDKVDEAFRKLKVETKALFETDAASFVDKKGVDEIFKDLRRLMHEGTPYGRCPACDGTGGSPDQGPCELCQGRGWVSLGKKKLFDEAWGGI